MTRTCYFTQRTVFLSITTPARMWWDEQLSGSAPVCLCWPVLTAFIRIGTNAGLHRRPLTIKEAIERVQSWLEQPCVRVIHPTQEHWPIFQRMLRDGKATGNLAWDTHLAALAVEHNCLLQTTDADFARFRGLKWSNDLGKRESLISKRQNTGENVGRWIFGLGY